MTCESMPMARDGRNLGPRISRAKTLRSDHCYHNYSKQVIVLLSKLEFKQCRNPEDNDESVGTQLVSDVTVAAASDSHLCSQHQAMMINIQPPSERD
jgi:hypothetical protein